MIMHTSETDHQEKRPWSALVADIVLGLAVCFSPQGKADDERDGPGVTSDEALTLRDRRRQTRVIVARSRGVQAHPGRHSISDVSRPN